MDQLNWSGALVKGGKDKSGEGRAGAGEPLALPEPRDFLPLMIRAHNNLVSAFENVCDIHIARWRLLFNLGRRGKSSQNELSRSTTIAPAAVTRMLADMERQGLIARNPSPVDNRQIEVTLTGKGETLLLETAAKRNDFLKQALAGLSEAEIVLLERLLGELERNLAAIR